MPGTHLFADQMAGRLSANAVQNLREARVTRHVERTMPDDELRRELAQRGFGVDEALLSLERCAGGAALPGAGLLGAACFLQACPDFSPRDQYVLEGVPLFPIFGDPEQYDDGQGPFGLMAPSGWIALYDPPFHSPLAFSSFKHFLEFIAFAPLGKERYTLRVDAFCGETVAGLLAAEEHLAVAGEVTRGWLGPDVWIMEVRAAECRPYPWWSLWGTQVHTTQPDLLVDLIPLLQEQGLALGYQGPSADSPVGAREVLAFEDDNPEIGMLARMRISVWGERGAYRFMKKRVR